MKDENRNDLPPLHHSKLALHHWLDAFDCDGRYEGRIVLQWNPGALRWSHSGNVGTGHYVDTKYWKYVGLCVMPN